jgi:hypothetical protein
VNDQQVETWATWLDRSVANAHQTAWNGAYEFIPDDAPWAVVEGEEELPKLVALDGQKLYMMTIGDLGEESLSGTATCRLVLIDTGEATVEFTTKLSGHRTLEPMSRDTAWTFDLGREKLAFSTKFSAGQSRVRPNELLA